MAVFLCEDHSECLTIPFAFASEEDLATYFARYAEEVIAAAELPLMWDLCREEEKRHGAEVAAYCRKRKRARSPRPAWSLCYDRRDLEALDALVADEKWLELYDAVSDNSDTYDVVLPRRNRLKEVPLFDPEHTELGR